jgi:inosose dehydratase
MKQGSNKEDTMLKRREVMKSLALTLGAACVNLPDAFAKGPSARNIKIGHTCITWSTFPAKPGTHDDTLNLALKDISAEGFWYFETFPQVLDDWDQRGLLAPLIAQYGVPLLSAYMAVDVLDRSKRKEEIARITRLCQLVKKYHGTYIVLQVNGIDPATYNFQEHRADIIAGLNDYAATITDLGLHTGLHQHTGTAVESRDEVYAVMDAVNTNRLTFAPDIGQLQKGGADPVQVVKDFLPILTHMHLKDYKGWQYYGGYCPLGMGMVDIPAILKMVESKDLRTGVMVELDPSKDGPMTPLETAKVSKKYLEKMGYKFRT